MDPGPKVAAHRSARPRNGLPCPSRLARRLRFSARKRLCAACRASNRRTSRCIHPSLRSSSDHLPAACLWLRRALHFVPRPHLLPRPPTTSTTPISPPPPPPRPHLPPAPL